MSAYDEVAAGTFAPALFAVHGRAVTYQARGASSGSSITAAPRELPGAEGVRRRRYWCSTDEVATAKVGDQVTDNSETWTVYEVGRVRGELVPLDAEITDDRG